MEKQQQPREREGETTTELRIMRDNFKSLRQAKGWSVKKLSEVSGISKKILTDIEEGEDFDVYYLIKLCRIYHIKPHEIFSCIS